MCLVIHGGSGVKGSMNGLCCRVVLYKTEWEGAFVFMGDGRAERVLLRRIKLGGKCTFARKWPCGRIEWTRLGKRGIGAC